MVLCWYALLRRRVGPASLAAGALVWLAVLGAVLAAAAPGGSYLAAWPALAGALTGLVAAVTTSRVLRVLTAVLGGAAAVVVLAPTVVLFFPALGLSTAAAPAAVATMLVVALLPALDLLFPDERGPAAVGGRGGAGGGARPRRRVHGVGLTVDRFDAAHPVPSRLAYALDTDTGQASWLSTEQSPGAWTTGFVGTRAELPVDLPYLDGPVWSGRAEPADLAAAEVATVSDSGLGTRRELSVRVTPQRSGVRMLVLDLHVEGGNRARARVAGARYPRPSPSRTARGSLSTRRPRGGLRATFSSGATAR